MPRWLGSLSQQMGSVSPLISHYQKLQDNDVRVITQPQDQPFLRSPHKMTQCCDQWPNSLHSAYWCFPVTAVTNAIIAIPAYSADHSLTCDTTLACFLGGWTREMVVACIYFAFYFFTEYAAPCFLVCFRDWKLSQIWFDSLKELPHN